MSAATSRALRTGFNTMHKHAGAYMRRKGIKTPGSFRKTNIHGGRLWGSRRECCLTESMAGNIIERVYESGKVGVAQLKQVRHSLSYAYYLTTGIPNDNYAEVKAQWKTFDLAKLPGVRKPKKPTRIPTPENLKLAFTTPWTPEHPKSLAKFNTGMLACHDTHVFGLRPNVDIAKVKTSKDHFINANERYGWTKMVGGRSKLHLHKRGTRAWRVYRYCFCQGRNHVSPPGLLSLDDEGNPHQDVTWNTVCPLAGMEFLELIQGPPIKIYAKWFPGRYGQNVGDVAKCANDWLAEQGVPGPFDRNSGRKTLSRWLELLHVPYPEALMIHGDLEQVWRSHYQSALLKSGVKTREQSEDPDTATRALRRFAEWLYDGNEPQPSLKQQLAAILEGMD